MRPVAKAVLVGFVCWLLVWCYERSLGVKVVVHNVDRRPISAVMVHVTGNSYELGELAPGASRSVYVAPTSESHVELTFIDADGRSKHLNAGGYFEQSYSGTYSVEMTADEIVRVDEDLNFY